MPPKRIHRGYFPKSKTDDWGTPPSLFDELDREFRFTLDPCSSHANAKCRKHFTKEENGLLRSWDGERVFMNPPYGRQIRDWIDKALGSRALVVMLLPSRTDTIWFHKLLTDERCSIRFLKGRLTFVRQSAHNHPAVFPSVIVVFDGISD